MSSKIGRKRLGVKKRASVSKQDGQSRSPNRFSRKEVVKTASFLKPQAHSPKPHPQSPNTPGSPPTLSSFNSDMDEALMAFMDQMDCGIISSTPLSAGSVSSRSCNKRNSLQDPSAIPNFDLSPTPDKVVSNSKSLLTTPLTSPMNTTKSLSILQTPHNKSQLFLNNWGLPDKIVEKYSSRGVTQMFEWQAECISLPGVLSGRNLVYSAPTSAGKTLIAELLSLKCVLERHKKVLIILPFVSVVHEKTTHLQSLFEEVGVKIGGFMGQQSPQGGLSAVDIAVCTIEKANSLVNHLLEDGSVNQVGMVVVDELHMVGDHHRGYLLELLLTKLLHICKKGELKLGLKIEPEGPLFTGNSLQVIGMSATLPNLSTLARWLNALVYHTDFRPVPLKEMIKIGNVLYDSDLKKISELKNGCESWNKEEEEEDIALICNERLQQGHSILIFCPTKAWCEKLSLSLAKAPSLQVLLTETTDLPVGKSTKSGLHFDKAGLAGVCEQLHRTQVGLDSVLAKTLPMGVAFHHAGLTFDEREIIEGAFRQLLIRILVATSTLSSGVNLPARLVIIRTPIFHQSVIDVLMYRQMIGRAGRKGIDEEGESILICKPSERTKVSTLLKSIAKPVQSCLGPSSLSGRRGVKGNELGALKRAILEIIANGTALCYEDIITYMSCTLLCSEIVENDIKNNGIEEQINPLLEKALQFLMEHEFVQKRNEKKDQEQNEEMTDISNDEYISTQFGSASVASALGPDDALIVFDEFFRARKALVLENELHIIYLVTPIYILDQWPTIDWYKFLCIWERLPPDMKHVASIVGVQESFIARAVQGNPPERTAIQRQKLRIHRRFFTSLALHDLVKEVPISYVSRKYGASKGLLQSLQSAAGTFAGMVTVFCSHLGWRNMEVLLSQFQSRLIFGIERELCDLVRVSLLNGCRARVLYNAGYHTLASLATANPVTIEAILRKAFPFKSKKDEGNDEKMAVNWCAKLKRGLSESEAAMLITQEAKHILCDELCIPLSAWDIQNGNPLYLPDQKDDRDNKDDLKFKETLKQPLFDNPISTAGATSKITPHSTVSRRNTRKVLNKQDPNMNSITKKCKLNEYSVHNQPPFPSLIETKSLTTHLLSNCQEKPIVKSTGFKIEGMPFSSFVPSSSIHKIIQHEPQLSSETLHSKDKEQSNTVIKIEDNHSRTSNDPVLHDVVATPVVKPSNKVKPNSTSTSSMDLFLDLSGDFSMNTIEQLEAVCNEAQLEDNVSIETHPKNRISSSPIHPSGIKDQPLQIKENILPLTTYSDINANSSPVQSPRYNNISMNTSTALKELSSLHTSTCPETGLVVVDVTANSLLLETFVAECAEQNALGFSVAIETIHSNNGIGGSLIKTVQTAKGLPLPMSNDQVMGVAFNWGSEMDVYYLSLCEPLTTPTSLDTSEIGCHPVVPLATRIHALNTILTNSHQYKIIAIDLKKQMKYLLSSCHVLVTGMSYDPHVADWLINPDAREKTLNHLVMTYISDQPAIGDAGENGGDVPLSSLATHSPFSYLRASAECVLANMLMTNIEELLRAEGLLDAFLSIEMPIVGILAKVEFNGIGFSQEQCAELRDQLQCHLSELEQEAYEHAGRTFALTSPDDIARVLFLEMKLPSFQSEKQSSKSLSVRNRGSKRLQHLSTSKDILERLCPLHPLPSLILEWRRVSSTVTRMLYPLLKASVTHTLISSSRIHSTCQIHTATGRISILDPNLQNVPKEYPIGLYKVSNTIQQSIMHSLIAEFDVCVIPPSEDVENIKTVCMRDVFVSFPGGVFLAADYSQLELRILAHMSKDAKLCQFLNGDGDAFRMIASEWLSIDPSNVSEQQRQQTKQLCYGMVYGIGVKALAQQLNITEDEAAHFMESFKSKYPTMRKFITNIVQQCRDKGYIMTISGRKRYLPQIHSTEMHARAQAERQAVNSTIQGSATDMVKKAMMNVDRALEALGLMTYLPRFTGIEENNSKKLALLVLQLHDELLYEVHESQLVNVARVVQREMENALLLTVKFPIKLKVGKSWGQLQSYSLDNNL